MRGSYITWSCGGKYVDLRNRESLGYQIYNVWVWPLLMKWWWSIVTTAKTAICTILREKYDNKCRTGNNGELQGTNSTQFWKGLQMKKKGTFWTGTRERRQDKLLESKCQDYEQFSLSFPKTYKATRDKDGSVKSSYRRSTYRIAIINDGNYRSQAERNKIIKKT